MDPNANLQEQERILGAHGRVHELDRQRLRELRSALAGWLSRHGFAPDWAACPRAAVYFGHGPAAAPAARYDVRVTREGVTRRTQLDAASARHTVHTAVHAGLEVSCREMAADEADIVGVQEVQS